ncbi:MAG: B12-binding domain-containing radical SAM protein [Desulfomonilaceae bacterium]|nr:B12-binding domain-containing radical SAM protein [Desulfomonilaceae bacterium]
MTKSVLLLGMPGWTIQSPLHSLFYVAALIRNVGWECAAVDMNVALRRLLPSNFARYWEEPVNECWTDPAWVDDFCAAWENDIADRLGVMGAERDYAITAFTVNGYTKLMSLKASKLLRSFFPDRTVLFGGVECFPGRSCRQFVTTEGGPDIICHGEAEIALPKFLKAFEHTPDYRTTVSGFAYKDGDEIVDTGPAETPTFSSPVPRPDWSGVDFSQYKNPGEFAVFFSRDCPNRCAFCDHRGIGTSFRTRDPEDVTMEIANARTWVTSYSDIPKVHFVDLCINGSLRKLEELCDQLIESHADIQWFSCAGFRPSMSLELLTKMRKSGCSGLNFGLESGSQKIIDLMNKGFTTASAEETLRRCRDLGIATYLGLIVGFPGETAADLVDTIKFVLRHRDYAEFGPPNLLQIYPNSPMGGNPGEWGVTSNEQDTWRTRDLRNDRNVRTFRRFVLGNAVFNGGLTTRSIFAWNEFLWLDLNQPSVAADVAAALYELWKSVSSEREKISILEEWPSAGKTVSSMEEFHWKRVLPENVPPDVDLSAWRSADKNRQDDKRRICRLILDALRNLRRVLLTETCSDRGI